MNTKIFTFSVLAGLILAGCADGTNIKLPASPNMVAKSKAKNAEKIMSVEDSDLACRILYKAIYYKESGVTVKDGISKVKNPELALQVPDEILNKCVDSRQRAKRGLLFSDENFSSFYSPMSDEKLLEKWVSVDTASSASFSVLIRRMSGANKMHFIDEFSKIRAEMEKQVKSVKAKERIERERVEKERLVKERIERERVEKERLVKER
ncbi:MAG: hypothetical protein IBX45_11855, partial [Campylobacterales bacterium]|nr:hypothetical protein [Campylobacterales bacterium]